MSIVWLVRLTIIHQMKMVNWNAIAEPLSLCFDIKHVCFSSKNTFLVFKFSTNKKNYKTLKLSNKHTKGHQFWSLLFKRTFSHLKPPWENIPKIYGICQMFWFVVVPHGFLLKFKHCSLTWSLIRKYLLFSRQHKIQLKTQ